MITRKLKIILIVLAIFPVSNIFAQSISDLKLIAENSEVIKENGQTYYVINLLLDNKSKSKIKYFSWSCSWQWLYFTNNENIKVKTPMCDKNIPIIITILPGKSIRKKIKLFFDKKSTQRERIKIGFHYIDANNKTMYDFLDRNVDVDNIIWSNEIVLQIKNDT